MVVVDLLKPPSLIYVTSWPLRAFEIITLALCFYLFEKNHLFDSDGGGLGSHGRAGGCFVLSASDLLMIDLRIRAAG